MLETQSGSVNKEDIKLSKNPKEGQSKISTFVLAAIYITLALSIVAIGVALGAYFEGEPIETTLALMGIGVIAMALAGYILIQSKKRMARLKIPAPPIITTIECKKCNTKTTREFQKGDYIFKELDACSKCEEEKQLITAIYRDFKQKEKTGKN